MKINLKIAIYLLCVILFFAMVVKYFDYRHKLMIELYTEDMLKQKELLMQSVKSMGSYGAKKNAEDYSLWDEMVGYIDNKDSVWAHDNLDTAPKVFTMNFIQVADKQGRIIFKTFYEIEPFKLNIDSTQMIKLFSKDSIVHFYQVVPQGLLEIYGATINFVTDYHRQKSPSGYYFSGLIWDRKYQESIEKLLDGKIGVITSKDPVRIVNPNQRKFSVSVADAFNTCKIAEIEVTYDLAKLANLSLFSRDYLLGMVLFLLFFIIATYLVMRQLVLKPVDILTEALSEEKFSRLKQIEKKNDEFGHLAQTVTSFFAPKKELEESNELFRKSFEDTSIGMALVGMDGRLVRFNQAFHQMLGYTNEEFSRSFYHHLIDYESEKNHVDNRPELLSGVIKNSVTEKPFKQKDGSIVWGILNASILYDADYQPKYYICQIQNITDRKMIEDNLENIVTRRTKELLGLNSDLKKALDELCMSQETIIKQEKLASLGTMLAGIAHEINNPTQAIKFSLDALDLNVSDLLNFIEEIIKLKDQPREEQLASLANLDYVLNYLDIPTVLTELKSFTQLNRDCVKRIENIVMSTKRMAYQESGFETCDLNEILKDALTLVDNQVKYQISEDVELDDRLPQVRGLRQELGQVFINIIINAKDAMVEKGLDKVQSVLRIKSFYDRERAESCILFEDQGVGIPKEHLDRLYDPFFTTKPPGKGTGLGLNIVHRIIKAHEGEIRVFSQVGKGTVITITIPSL